MTSEENNDATDDGEAMPGEIILNHSLNTEMKNSYINYAMSVIIGRALPDARDSSPFIVASFTGCLKAATPPIKKFSKSARSVGEVMGKYHLTAISRSTTPWCEWHRNFRFAIRLWTGKGTRFHRRRPARCHAIHRKSP